MATTSVLGPQITQSGAAGRQIAAVLIGITKAQDTPLEGFQIMLRSASSARAARIARKLIERHHHKLIAAALEGSLAAQRAGVMLALIAGFQLMRQVLELPALAQADPAALVKVLGPVFDGLLALVECGRPVAESPGALAPRPPATCSAQKTRFALSLPQPSANSVSVTSNICVDTTLVNDLPSGAIWM
jgi:hypothetical protein